MATKFISDDSLLTRISKAIPERARHAEAHEEFEKSLVRHGADVPSWRTAVEAWEIDRRNPNPYKTVVVSE